MGLEVPVHPSERPERIRTPCCGQATNDREEGAIRCLLLRVCKDKRAVVFGGGGSIGAASPKSWRLREPRGVSGRPQPWQRRGGHEGDHCRRGRAYAHQVDGLNETAVDELIESVVQESGGVDIEFNATGPRISECGNGKPAVELRIDENHGGRGHRIAVPVHHGLSDRSADGLPGLGCDHLPDRQPSATARANDHGHQCGLRRDRKRHAGHGHPTRPRWGQGGVLADRGQPDSQTIRDTTDVIGKMMNITSRRRRTWRRARCSKCPRTPWTQPRLPRFSLRTERP